MTDETKIFHGRTVHRIRALQDFSLFLARELGGWVEKEENLSQTGTAWVYGNACVFDNAQVGGNALVYGNAKVYHDACVCGSARVHGDAQVCGNALVYGNAKVCGDACVFGDVLIFGDALVFGSFWGETPLYIQGSKFTFNVVSDHHVRCGCQIHTWREWHDHYMEIALKHGSEDIVPEYVRYFNLACHMYGHEDCLIETTDKKDKPCVST